MVQLLNGGIVDFRHALLRNSKTNSSRSALHSTLLVMSGAIHLTLTVSFNRIAVLPFLEQ